MIPRIAISGFGRIDRLVLRPGKVETGEGVIKIDGQQIIVLNQKDPSRLPWKQLGIDIVIESTGVFMHGRARRKNGNSAGLVR